MFHERTNRYVIVKDTQRQVIRTPEVYKTECFGNIPYKDWLILYVIERIMSEVGAILEKYCLLFSLKKCSAGRVNFKETFEKCCQVIVSI